MAAKFGLTGNDCNNSFSVNNLIVCEYTRDHYTNILKPFYVLMWWWFCSFVHLHLLCIQYESWVRSKVPTTMHWKFL